MAIKKTGLLGGSFDPVHLAHIALAKAARQTLRLDEVELIPAANPWQRKPLNATARQRLAMLELAIAGEDRLRINPIEIKRGGQTRTIDTISCLPENIDYTWILGADQLANFCSWHYWQDIVAHVNLAVAQRPGTPLAPPPPLIQHLAALGRSLIELPFEPMPISATAIRERLARGLSTQGLLNVAVAQYIEQNNLYQAPYS
jgi:nicotinate-nucleotide adenylyltransferase